MRTVRWNVVVVSVVTAHRRPIAMQAQGHRLVEHCERYATVHERRRATEGVVQLELGGDEPTGVVMEEGDLQPALVAGFAHEAVGVETPVVVESDHDHARHGSQAPPPGCDSGRIVNTPDLIPYSDELRKRLARNLERHRRRSHELDGRKHAAVAIVLVDSHPADHDDDPVVIATIDMAEAPGDVRGFDGRMVGVAGGAAFLLCRRPTRMNRHAGQWAFPGGRVDPGETALDAALREVDEEIGVRLGADSVVGWLDDYPTRSGYVISPVVVWGGADPELRPSPDEVLAIYRVGLHTLRDTTPRYVSIPESDRPVVQLPIGRDLIHAPTGAVLHQFRQVAMAGRADERVDHLEQPVFAWT